MVALVRTVIVALLLVIWVLPGPRLAQAAGAGSPPTERPSAAAGAAVPRATPTKPLPGTVADVERLAERERQAGHLESFEGGSRIGTTTIIIILLLLIVLVLVIR